MIIAFAVAGLLVGSLLNWARDYLPRYAAQRPASLPGRPPRLDLAVWRLLTSPFNADGFGKEHRAGLLVEVLTAVVFAFLRARSDLSWDLLFRITAGCYFILIALIDLRYRLVLNVTILPALAILLGYAVFFGSNTTSSLAGGAFGLLPFAAAALVHPGGLGSGDVKLSMLIGLMFGFPHVVWVLLVCVLVGGFTTTLLLLTHRGALKSRIPYAPFLSCGAIVALLLDFDLFSVVIRG